MANFLIQSEPEVANADAQEFAQDSATRLKNMSANALVSQYGPQAADPTMWSGAVNANTAQQISPLKVQDSQLALQSDQLKAKQAEQGYDKQQAGAVIATISHLIGDEGMEPGAALDTVASHAQALGVDTAQLEQLKPMLQQDPAKTIAALNEQLNPDKAQVFGQPVYSKDATGKVTIGYATKDGKFKNINVGDGQQVIAPGTGSVQIVRNADGTYGFAQSNKAGGVNTTDLPTGVTPEKAFSDNSLATHRTVEEAQAAQRIKLEAARVRISAEGEVRRANQGAGGGGALSPQTVDYLADQFRTTGKLPALGMGGSSLRAAILNSAAQKAAAAGANGQADVYAAQATHERATAVSDLGKATPTSAGGRVQSANALITHLDQLGGLSAGLTSGNLPAINAAKQAYMRATGSAAPTNFNAVKTIAADEAVKFIVANGGTLHDRQQAQAMFSAAQSPQQLAGAIQQVQHLAAGQLGGMRQRYQAIGATNEFDGALTPRTKQLLGLGQPPQTPTAALRAKYGMQ